MGEDGPKQKSPIKTFRDLRIYQMAREQSRQIYQITRKPPFSKDYSLAKQAQSASVSVMANIAEGFERANRLKFNSETAKLLNRKTISGGGKNG